jgi:aldehyde:ferredoxin oxidoreductase
MEVWFDPCFEEADAAPELGITKPVGATEYTDKGRITAIVEDFISWLNSLITCAFNTPGTGNDRVNQDLVNALSAATGWDYSVDEALETGNRAFNMCRMFNVREGWGREQDVIPHVFTQPTTTGDNPNDVIAPADFKAMLNEYYRHRGWDEDGIPTEKTLKNLGLDVIM